MNIAKALTLVTLIICSAGFFVAPETDIAGWGRLLFLIIVGVHFIEFFFYIPAIRKLGGSMLPHFFQVLLFGLFHYMDIKKKLADREAVQ
jgi:hypothetical protein